MYRIKPKIIAHRGFSHYAPENTLASCITALDHHADYLEIDVQLSKDGIPVVIHDTTLERTVHDVPTGRVIDFTAFQLTGMDAGKWFHPDFIGTPISLLDDILNLPRHKTGLFMEIKGEDCEPKAIVQAVLARLKLQKDADVVIIGSYYPDILEEVLSAKPHQPVLGIADEEVWLEYFLDKGFKHLALDYRMLNEEMVKKLVVQGIRIWSFTVDDYHIAHDLVTWGVEGIITNNPNAMSFFHVFSENW